MDAVSKTFPFNQPDCGVLSCEFKAFQDGFCWQHVSWWARSRHWLKEHAVSVHVRSPVYLVVRYRNERRSIDENWLRAIKSGFKDG